MHRKIMWPLLVFSGVFAASPAQADAPAIQWTGFYVGLNAGAAFEDSKLPQTDIPINQVTNLYVPTTGGGKVLVVVPGTTRPFGGSFNETKFNGGGQAGYLFSVGQFVLGAEGELDFTPGNSSLSEAVSLPPTRLTPATMVTFQRDLDYRWEWSARLRAGYAFGANLIYATGGIAGTRVRLRRMDTYSDPGGPGAPCPALDPTCTVANLGPGRSVVTDEARFHKTGWTVGGGIERSIAEHISVALEFRHTDFGDAFASFPVTYGYTTDEIGSTPHGSVVFNPYVRDFTGNSGNQGVVDNASTSVKLRNNRVGVRVNFRF